MGTLALEQPLNAIREEQIKELTTQELRMAINHAKPNYLTLQAIALELAARATVGDSKLAA